MANVKELISSFENKNQLNAPTPSSKEEKSEKEEEKEKTLKDESKKRKPYKELKYDYPLYMPSKDYKLAKEKDYKAYIDKLEEKYPNVLSEDERKNLSVNTKVHIFASKKPHNDFLVQKKEAFYILNKQLGGPYDIDSTKDIKGAIKKLQKIIKLYGHEASKEQKEEIINLPKLKREPNAYMKFMKNQKKHLNESLKEFKERCKEEYAKSLNFENYGMFKIDRDNKKKTKAPQLGKNLQKVKKSSTEELKELKEKKLSLETRLNELVLNKNIDDKKEVKSLKGKIDRLIIKINAKEKLIT
jgi:hypothetical protein